MNFRETVDNYFRFICEGNREAWLDQFTDHQGLVHADPVGAPVRQTKAEIGQFWDSIMGLFSTVTLRGVEFYPGGDQLAVKWKANGVGHNGALVEFEGIDIFTADSNAKILQMQAYWDAQPTLAKLMA